MAKKLAKDFDAYSFQILCKDILTIIYNGEIFDIYGRNGQIQNGIDILSTPCMTSNNQKVAQCKFFDDTAKCREMLISQVNNDYSIAINNFNFTDFIVMTSLDRDINIQNKILQISILEHPIHILFWDDIEQIALNNHEILKLHFGKYLNSFDMGNFSANQKNFKESVKCVFGKYDINKFISEPNYNGPFDENVIYNCEYFCIEFEDLLEKWTYSPNCISSKLIEKCQEFVNLLSYYYSLIRNRTISNIPCDGFAYPVRIITQEDLNALFECKQNLYVLYNEVKYLMT